MGAESNTADITRISRNKRKREWIIGDDEEFDEVDGDRWSF